MAIDEVREEDKFFELIAIGGHEELRKVKEHIENDPKRYIFAKSDIRNIVNKFNRFKQTPLYVACKHGNLKMIELLLE